jgi:hypothetical protein
MGKIMRGGKREGAGRPPKEEKTVCYHRRVLPEWVEELDKKLNELKATKNPSKIN